MDEAKDLIVGIGRRMQGQAKPEPRAAEIGAEVLRLNERVLQAAPQLSFDDEPAAYAVVLARNARR